MTSDLPESSEPAEPLGSKSLGSGPDSTAARVRPPDASGWNWLLVVPILIPLLTTFYNRDTPRFLGFPAFYWLQLSFVLLGVACTTLVYRMTRRKG